MLLTENARKGKLRRRIVDVAVLALFLLHALVPVGFMPDVDALQIGKLEIVICTGTGFKTLTVDENGNPLPNGGSAPVGQVDKAKCPFGGATFKPVSVSVVPFVSAPAPRQSTAPVVSAASSIASQILGPVPGPRAPPAILG